MLKQKTAILLFMAIVLKTGIYANAEEVHAPEENYVVMAEDMETIKEVLETEIVTEEITEEDPEALMQESGIAAVDLNSWEVRQLEKADIIVEEDILFDAAASCDMQQAEDTKEENLQETEIGGEPFCRSCTELCERFGRQ